MTRRVEMLPERERLSGGVEACPLLRHEPNTASVVSPGVTKVVKGGNSIEHDKRRRRLRRANQNANALATLNARCNTLRRRVRLEPGEARRCRRGDERGQVHRGAVSAHALVRDEKVEALELRHCADATAQQRVQHFWRRLPQGSNEPSPRVLRMVPSAHGECGQPELVVIHTVERSHGAK